MAILDDAENLRTLRRQADRRTADLIPALFDRMFGDPVRNPKGWPTVRVSDFVAGFEGGKSLVSIEDDKRDDGFRVLTVSAVTWKDYRPEESKLVPEDYAPPTAHVVREHDLLFSRANTTELVGAVAYVFSTPPKRLLPDKLWRFVWREPSTTEPLWVWALFQQSSIRHELGKRASGTSGSMKNISKPKVPTIPVPLPPLPLQKQFAAAVGEIRAMQEQQAASRRRLDDLFHSLLHRAFKGQL